MRRIIIFLLLVAAYDATGQVTAGQIRAVPPYDSLQFLVNDTVPTSPYYRRGTWMNAYNVIATIADSLGLAGGLTDTDWLKYGSTDVIPDNDDTMYHVGPIMVGPLSDTVSTWTGTINVVGRWDTRFPNSNSRNIAIGRMAGGISSGTQGYNIAIGDSSLFNAGSAGLHNVAIGRSALLQSTSRYNTAVGYEALRSGSGGVGGGYSVALGYQAGRGSSFNAVQNTIIGARAGYLNTTGDGNIFIGYQAGYNETGSNWLYIDNTPTSTPLIKGDFAADSLHVFGKLGYATDGGTPDRLAGLGNSQFTSIYTGFGIMLDGDTLKVDTTQVSGGGGGGGGANLSIEGAGPIYSIASSSGTDVYVESDGTVLISEPGADTLMLKVDTTIVATQYDISSLDPSTTNELQDITVTGASQPFTMDLSDDADDATFTGGGITTITRTGNALTWTSTEIDGSVNNEGSLSVGPGTGTTSLIQSNTSGSTDITLQAGGIITLGESGNTITIGATEVDGAVSNEGIIGVGAGVTSSATITTNTSGGNAVTINVAGILSVSESTSSNGGSITLTATEGDGSPTNELQTVQENDITVTGGTSINTFDFGSMFDLTAGSGEANINIDLGEAATVSTIQEDDYVIFYDNGTGIEEKILATDLLSEPITVYDNGATAGSGKGLNFGIGFSAAEVANTFDINLLFGEFAIDAATEGDEYVILYDPSTVSQERVLVSSFGADGNGIYGGSGTVPTNTTATLTDGTFKFTGATANVRIEDTGTDAALLLDGNIGNSDARMAYIDFQYTDSGYASDQSAIRIEAHRENDNEEYYTLRTVTASTGITSLEHNAALSDNTNENAIYLHGGVAKTEYWESSGANAVTLDRGYYNVALVSGHSGTITLPEISGLAEHYLEVATAQVPVGQEYVITNISGSPVTIAAINNIGTLNDDWLGSTSSVFAEAGTYSLASGKAVIIKAVTTVAGEGYWFVSE